MSAEYTFRHSCSGPLNAAFAESVFEAVDSVLVATCEAEITGGITVSHGPSSVRFDSPGALRAAIPPLEPLSGFRLTRFPARPGSFPPEPSVTVSMAAGDTSLSVFVSASDLTAAQDLAIALSSAFDKKYSDQVQDKNHRIKPCNRQISKKHLKPFYLRKKFWKEVIKIIGKIVSIVVGGLTAFEIIKRLIS